MLAHSKMEMLLQGTGALCGSVCPGSQHLSVTWGLVECTSLSSVPSPSFPRSGVMPKLVHFSPAPRGHTNRGWSMLCFEFPAGPGSWMQNGPWLVCCPVALTARIQVCPAAAAAAASDFSFLPFLAPFLVEKNPSTSASQIASPQDLANFSF